MLIEGSVKENRIRAWNFPTPSKESNDANNSENDPIPINEGIEMKGVVPKKESASRTIQSGLSSPGQYKKKSCTYKFSSRDGQNIGSAAVTPDAEH